MEWYYLAGILIAMGGIFYILRGRDINIFGKPKVMPYAEMIQELRRHPVALYHGVVPHLTKANVVQVDDGYFLEFPDIAVVFRVKALEGKPVEVTYAKRLTAGIPYELDDIYAVRRFVDLHTPEGLIEKYSSYLPPEKIQELIEQSIRRDIEKTTAKEPIVRRITKRRKTRVERVPETADVDYV